MCGIAGIARRTPTGVSLASLGRMAAAIRHRGPDGYGFFVSQRVGLAHVRLSIIDIAGGAQPLTNEDSRIVVIYNGEIYNHVELRRLLEQCGHVFKTRCDTEVLVHGYEEWGAGLLPRLNGQFAFAIYDSNREEIFIARDRFGVRPLFYAQRGGDFYFGSEIKAILATGEVDASLDNRGLDEVISFWAAKPPRTMFDGIASLEPGTYGVWNNGALHLRNYYEIDYPEADEEPADVVERLDEILLRSVGMRLRADVPVGAYVSGGLDSSITASLAASGSPLTLRSFSIAFDDPEFDESSYQREVADVIGSVHATIKMDAGSIAQSLPEVVWHAETPLLRTAPVPMYLLAKRVKESGIKVVLTGEGADELFLGYDLFKEVSVRRFCMRRPDSAVRQQLFGRLYPYLIERGRGGEFWRRFFLDAGPMDDPLFSHLPRFLLSSQGDRMAMAHGVESRYPFLDHRMFEFAAALPTGSRLRGLREKEILRRWASRILPERLKTRTKQPYRAPGALSLFGTGAPEWIGDYLATDAVKRAGIFSATGVEALARRCRAGLATGSRENQAIIGVLSTQLWYRQFVDNTPYVEPLDPRGATVLLNHLPSSSSDRALNPASHA